MLSGRKQKLAEGGGPLASMLKLLPKNLDCPLVLGTALTNLALAWRVQES